MSYISLIFSINMLCFTYKIVYYVLLCDLNGIVKDIPSIILLHVYYHFHVMF